MPITFFTMFVGTLAISGVPLFSGFFSKDEILYKAFSSEHGSAILWAIGLIAALLTAFYMFRLLFLTFYGKSRMNPDVEKHAHESPRIMTIPLMILAVLAFIGGYIGLPHALGGGAWFEEFLSPVFTSTHEAADADHQSYSIEYLLMLTSVVAAGIGILVAYRFYISDPERPKRLAERFNGLYNTALNKYYVDEFYNAVIVRPMITAASFFWRIIDIMIVDGIANGSARMIGWFSGKFRFVQTGLFRNYALLFVFGVIVLLGFVILR
jgi:NADH-quinone oxidoreductase subunit L